MQIERLFVQALEPGQPGFGIAPKAFDSINMTFIMNKLILSMVDSEVLLVSEANKPVVASPIVRMDHTLKVDSTSENRLQRGSAAIRNYLGKDTSIKPEDTDHNSIIESTMTSFLLNTTNAEKAFVNFNFSRKKRLALTELGNSFSDACKLPVNSIPVESGNFSNLRSVQIDGK
jgi:hypothetical protein